jgi:predicted nicotinamide N-methyase
MMTTCKMFTSLLATQRAAKRFHQAGVPCSFFSTTVGGWKIPKATTSTSATSNTNNKKKQSPIVETFSFHHPYTQELIQIFLQQRFTVAPETATATTNNIDNDQTGTWVWPTTHVLLDYFLQQQHDKDDKEDDGDYLQHLLRKCSKRSETDHGITQDRDNAATATEDTITTTSTSSTKRTTIINILELGSGCGLLGMALAALAWPHYHVHVTLTDHEGNINWLQQNLALNRSQWMLHHQQQVVEARTLSWGKYKDSNVTLLEKEHQQQNLKQQQQQPIDIIVGSDLIYERANHEALVETLIGLKDANVNQFEEKYPTILLAYPHRDKSTEDNFFQLLLADGRFRNVQKKQLDKNVILAIVD